MNKKAPILWEDRVGRGFQDQWCVWQLWRMRTKLKWNMGRIEEGPCTKMSRVWRCETRGMPGSPGRPGKSDRNMRAGQCLPGEVGSGGSQEAYLSGDQKELREAFEWWVGFIKKGKNRISQEERYNSISDFQVFNAFSCIWCHLTLILTTCGKK